MQTPTIEEIAQFCAERNNGIDPEAFFYFYQANGWVQGKARKPIKSWKACVITWEKSRPKAGGPNIIHRLTDVSWATDLLTNN